MGYSLLHAVEGTGLELFLEICMSWVQSCAFGAPINDFLPVLELANDLC